MTGTFPKFDPKPVTPTPDLAETVRTLGRKGEEFFDAAQLRPADERWWRTTVEGIATEILDAAKVRALTDAQLAAEMPPERLTDRQNTFRPRAEVEREYVKGRRGRHSHTLAVGFLLRDAVRIELEGIHFGSEAIRARSQLRAFAVVIAKELNCVTLRDENGNYDE